jgi:hypothetical protein
VTALLAALVEIEAHVAAAGWDQPPRLFALADSTDLVAREPALAASLDIDTTSGLTPIEQEGVPTDRALDDVLNGLMWPEAVIGAAVVVERIVLPPEAEDDLPAAEGAALQYASEHPARTEIRLVGGVLRDGTRQAILRVRGHELPADFMTGPEIAPGLLDALTGTFEP